MPQSQLVECICVPGFDDSDRDIIPCIVSSFGIVIDCSEAEKKGILRTKSLQTGEKKEVKCEFLRDRQCHAAFCEQSPVGIFLIFLLSYFTDEQKHRKRFVFACGRLMGNDGNHTVKQVGNEHHLHKINSPEHVKWFTFQRDVDGTLYLIIQWYGSKPRPQMTNDPNDPLQINTMFHLIHLKLRSFSLDEIKTKGLIEASVTLAFGQDVPGKCKRAYIFNHEIRLPKIGSDREVRIAVAGCDKPGIVSEFTTANARGKSDEPLRCGDFLVTYEFDEEKHIGNIWTENICLQQSTTIVTCKKYVICSEGHQLLADDNGVLYLLGKCAEGSSHIYNFQCIKAGCPEIKRINPTASQMVALTAVDNLQEKSKSEKVRIIHGPPSSGKSTVLWLMLLHMISEGKKLLLYLSKADDKAELEAFLQLRGIQIAIGLIEDAFVMESIPTEGILFINRLPHLSYEQKNYLLLRNDTSVVVIDEEIPSAMQQPRARIDWIHLSAVIGNEQQKSPVVEIRESLWEKCNRRWIKVYGMEEDCSSCQSETKLIRFTDNSECSSNGKQRGNDAEFHFAKTFLKLNLGGYLFWGFDTQQFLTKIRKMKVLGRFYEELADASWHHFEADFIFVHWHFGIHLIEVKAASEYKSPMKLLEKEEENETEIKAKRPKLETKKIVQTTDSMFTSEFPLNKAHIKAVSQLGKQYVVLNKISETFLGTELSGLHRHICYPNAIFPEELKDENCSYIDKTMLNDEKCLYEYWNKWKLSMSDKKIAAEWQEKLKRFIIILSAYDFDVLRKSADKPELSFSDNQNGTASLHASCSRGQNTKTYYGNTLSAANAAQTKTDITSDQLSRINVIRICPKNNNTNYRVTEILREGNPEVKTRILVTTESADSATNYESGIEIFRPNNNLNQGREIIIVPKENLAEIEDKVRKFWKPRSVMVVAESEYIADDVRSSLANNGIPCGTINECGDFIVVDVEQPDLEKSFWDTIIYLK